MDDSTLYSSFVSFGITYQKAWIHDEGSENLPSIHSLKTIKDLDENKTRTFLESYHYSTSLQHYCKSQHFPVEMVKTVIFSQSPSKKKTIVFRTVEKKTIIELFDCNADASGDSSGDNDHPRTHTYGSSQRIDTSKLHGDVMGDTWFGGQSWSDDERYFVYVCKPKDNSRPSSFGYDTSTAFKNEQGNQLSSLSKYDFIDDWGEKFDDISSLIFAVVDTWKSVIILIPDLHHDTKTIGQPCFHPNTNGNNEKIYELVYTCWNNEPRKLGMIYCYQRSCALYYVDITDLLISSGNQTISRHKMITPNLPLSRSPRFNSSGNILAFIGRSIPMSSHNGCMELFLIRNMNFEKDTLDIEKIIDIVYRPEDNSFPGLFCDQLPYSCFYQNDEKILISSLWGGRDVVLSISIESKTIRNFSDDYGYSDSNHCGNDTTTMTTTMIPWKFDMNSSTTLLDVSGSYILLVSSNPIQPPSLFLLNVETKSIYHIPNNSNNSITSINPNIPVSTKRSSILPVDSYFHTTKWKIYQFTSPDGIVFESILVVPFHSDIVSNRKPIPVIVVPHGGPHSCLTSSFYTSYAFLVSKLHAAVLYVNYRGSTGFGEDSIRSLLGNIGKNDVADVIHCLEHSLSLSYQDFGFDSLSSSSEKENQKKDHHQQKEQLLDKSRVAIVGGSHGGFLTAHLIGQYPDMFCVACMRNPVTNIPSMVSTSDIPDWCWVESGEEYHFHRFNLPSEEILIKMRRLSPIQHVDRVRTPTLICLGGKDRRVHPSQGYEYYHLLKSRSVTCRLVIYPEDSHPIDKPTTEGEQWLVVAEWLSTYLNIN